MITYLDTLFPAGEPTLLTGIRGSGKSTFAHELCMGNLTSFPVPKDESSEIISHVQVNDIAIQKDQNSKPSIIVLDEAIDVNCLVDSPRNLVKIIAEYTQSRMLVVVNVRKEPPKGVGILDAFRQHLQIHKDRDANMFYVSVMKHSDANILGMQFMFKFNDEHEFRQKGIIFP